MLTNANILHALEKIDDPELHKSIVALNMVRNIQIKGTHISLDVILTIQECPLKAKIQQDVEQALLNIRASIIGEVFTHLAEDIIYSSSKRIAGMI